MDILQKNLEVVFGFSVLKEGQMEIMRILVERKESALAVFPTGAGKSLCYQLSALNFTEGLTLVVCPLLALMKDQVDFLRSRGVAACAINSNTDAYEYEKIYEDLRSNRVRLLYVAPERFRDEQFLENIDKVPIEMFVVDESHCISEWGHSFRPDFLRLAEIAKQLKSPRVLCLTATATLKVAHDILRGFDIPPQNFVRLPTRRPNLTLRVIAVTEMQRYKSILQTLRGDLRDYPGGCGLIYCTTQQQTEDTCRIVTSEGFRARPYHAGMSQEIRDNNQQWLMAKHDTGIKIICATLAFGMGIDKSDIRFVYHAFLPKSLESYSQEIGRAGRDGKPSVCRVFLCADDIPLLRSFANGDTPSRTTVYGILSNLFFHNPASNMGTIFDYSPGKRSTRMVVKDQVVELNHHSLAREWDVRKNTLKIMLSHLEVYGGFVLPMNNVRRDRVMNRYRILKLPLDFESLVDEVFNRHQTREKDELTRLSNVLDLLQADSCLTKRLMEYFGDTDVPDKWRCEKCEFCITGKPTLLLPQSHDRIFSMSYLDEIIERVFRLYGCGSGGLHWWAGDECQTGTRFLLGLPSPRLEKSLGNTFRSQEDYGKLNGFDFGLVLNMMREKAATRRQSFGIGQNVNRRPGSIKVEDGRSASPSGNAVARNLFSAADLAEADKIQVGVPADDSKPNVLSKRTAAESTLDDDLLEIKPLLPPKRRG